MQREYRGPGDSGETLWWFCMGTKRESKVIELTVLFQRMRWDGLGFNPITSRGPRRPLDWKFRFHRRLPGGQQASSRFTASRITSRISRSQLLARFVAFLPVDPSIQRREKVTFTFLLAIKKERKRKKETNKIKSKLQN